MSQKTPEIDLIKKRDLAKRLAVSPWTIDEWVRKGKFPPPIYVMPGAPARWRVKDVEAWLAKCRRSRAKQTPRGMFRKAQAKEHHAHDAAHDAARPDDGADKDAVREAFATKFRGAITSTQMPKEPSAP